MATKKIKGSLLVENDLQVNGDLALSGETANTVPYLDGSKELVSSLVTPTELGYLDGVTSAIQDQLDDKVETSEVGAPNGIATLDGAGKVPVSQLPNAIMEYQGTWNATTNSPALADGGGNADEDVGNVYRVSVAGTQNLGSGNITFAVGDYAILNSSKVWEKADTTDAVSSVNSLTGAVVLDTDDITEGSTNLYFTEARVRGTVLTGYSSTGTNLSPSHDILTAFEILDAAVTDAQADIDNHIGDTSDAHDSSAISYDNTISGLTATDVKAAIDEVYAAVGTGGSAGDLAEDSFSLANNQASPANVTGFLFNNAVVRSFDALISVEIDATTNLFESFRILGIQKDSLWDIAIESTGDNSLIVFTITTGGQIQYVSGNYTGFTSGLIKFRSITTSI